MAAPEPVDHLLNHYVTVTTNVLQTLADASNQTNDDYLIWTLLREELHRATQIHDDLHVASALFHAEAGDFRRTNVILDEEQHARSLCVQVQAKYEVHLQALNIQIVAPAHHNAQDGTNNAAHEIGFSSDASSGISDDTPTSSEDGDNTSSALEADTTSGEVQCLGCTDSCHPDQAVSAACGHSYCATCATSFIKAAMSDRSIFPPTCCDKELLDVDQAKWFMTRDDSIRFDQISAEYYTIDPLYCAAPDCAAFLPGYEKQVICDGCGTTTCRDCGKHDHTGLCAVEEDLGTQQLRATAQAKGWKRCIGCTAMVERTTGCNQMTCKCKAQFCYRCGLIWKTCDCHPDDGTDIQAAAALQANSCRHVYYSTEFTADLPLSAVPAPLCGRCRFPLTTFWRQCSTCHMQLCRRCQGGPERP